MALNIIHPMSAPVSVALNIITHPISAPVSKRPVFGGGIGKPMPPKPSPFVGQRLTRGWWVNRTPGSWKGGR